MLSRIIELFSLILVRPEWSKWMDHKCTIRSEIFYLFRNGLTDVLLMSGALTVRNFLGMDLENKRADMSRLLLAVSWRYLRAGFLLNSRPWEPIKKAIKIKHLRNKNSNMDNLKDNTWENVNSPIFFTWSLCSLGCGLGMLCDCLLEVSEHLVLVTVWHYSFSTVSHSWVVTSLQWVAFFSVNSSF